MASDIEELNYEWVDEENGSYDKMKSYKGDHADTTENTTTSDDENAKNRINEVNSIAQQVLETYYNCHTVFCKL